MYVGTYLSSKDNNIGHEVINLIQTDKGENYISAMPYSTIAPDKIGKVKTVLLVRSHSVKLLEILAKAEIEKEVTDEEDNFNYSFQEKYITGDDNDNSHKIITYGGHHLHDIYKENKNCGNGKGSLITFKVIEGGLKRVKKGTRLFITTDKDLGNKDKNIFFIGDINFPSQEHKTYFSPNADITHTSKKNKKEYKNAYSELDKLINNKEYSHLWEENNTTKKISTKYINEIIKNEEHSMIDILDKKDAENTYSNFFYYIFDSNHKLFQRFANDILKITDISDDYTIAREEGRIDLLIYDDKYVVVIENKIKSGIHGEKYNLNGEIITNQLKKYYKYVTEKPNDNKKLEKWNKKFGKIEDNNKKFYIFAPNYNKIETKKIDGKEFIEIKDTNKYYEIIRYKEIFDFFDDKKIQKKYLNTNKPIPYYEEFLYALEKHSNNTDNHYETEILKRFVKVIKHMND